MTMAVAAPPVALPTDAGVLLVVTDGARYNATLRHVMSQYLDGRGQGVLITANRPAAMLRDGLAQQGLDLERLVIVDCISSLTGLQPAARPGVVHVESPTLLEALTMRAEQALRRMTGPKFLVLDSLSALAVYNGTSAVAEAAHGLANRLRMHRIPAAFLLVERQAKDDLQDAVRPLCDGMARL